MMSPACGCQHSVRLERLLSEAAADSWPHSGLAEFLSIADVTRRSCDLHQRGDDPVGVGVMRAPHLAHAAAAQQLDKATRTACPPPAAAVVAAIESLAGLHQRGILSDEEFAAKKAELLGRL
jgi:hypothetical protein